MINLKEREAILRKIKKDEDRLLISKVLDKAAQCEKSNSLAYTHFFDPYQGKLVEQILGACKSKGILSHDVDYSFTGGYDNAERIITIFTNDFMKKNYIPPLQVLKIKHKFSGSSSYISLSHRDYLGSLMALGIKREFIGDILVHEDGCDIIVLGEITDYLIYNIEKVGNVRVSMEIANLSKLESPIVRTREIQVTVASLRLDCIAKVGFSESRTDISDLIKSEKVFVNWEMVSNPSKLLKSGDTVSVRGYGRIVLTEVGGQSRKGRTIVRITVMV